MRTWTTRQAPWLLVLALIAGAAAMHVRTVAAAPSPEATIAAALASRGALYAGDCAATLSPRDLGRFCTRLVEEQRERRAYLVGRTFSEFSGWLFLGRSTDGWRVLGEAPFCFECQLSEVPWP